MRCTVRWYEVRQSTLHRFMTHERLRTPRKSVKVLEPVLQDVLVLGKEVQVPDVVQDDPVVLPAGKLHHGRGEMREVPNLELEVVLEE